MPGCPLAPQLGAPAFSFCLFQAALSFLQKRLFLLPLTQLVFSCLLGERVHTLSLQVNVEASLVGTCLSIPHPQPPTFQNLLQVGVPCLEPRTLAGLAAGLFLLVLWVLGLCFCPVARLAPSVPPL